MRTLIKFFSICLFITTSYAQDKPVFTDNNFSLNFSQTYSKFKFTDSEGNLDKSLKSDIHYSFAMNYNRIFESGFYLRPELGYKNFGAISNYYSDQKLAWDLDYFDFNFGIGYIFNNSKVKPYIGTALYLAYLFKAEQTLGDYDYDLIENEAIKQFDVGINLNAGIVFKFSQVVSFLVEYRNAIGLNQLEPNAEEGQDQKLYNRAMSVHLGICFYMKGSGKKKSGIQDYDFIE